MGTALTRRDSNMAVSIVTKLCKAGLSYDCSLSVVNSSLMIRRGGVPRHLDGSAWTCNLFTGRRPG